MFINPPTYINMYSIWLSTFTWLPCTYIVMTMIHIVIIMLLERPCDTLHITMKCPINFNTAWK